VRLGTDEDAERIDTYDVPSSISQAVSPSCTIMNQLLALRFYIFD
jgi:hypothetical protein